MYSSDIYQAGVTPGIKIFRRGQGVPDWPNSLLLYKDKESANSSRFNAHQLTIPAVQARIQCGLVLGSPGVTGGCTTMFHPVTKVNPSLHRAAMWLPLASVPINLVILYSSYNLREIFGYLNYQDLLNVIKQGYICK